MPSGSAGDLQLEATEAAGADDPAADAAAQRHGGVDHHKTEGLAPMQSARALISRQVNSCR